MLYRLNYAVAEYTTPFPLPYLVTNLVVCLFPFVAKSHYRMTSLLFRSHGFSDSQWNRLKPSITFDKTRTICETAYELWILWMLGRNRTDKPRNMSVFLIIPDYNNPNALHTANMSLLFQHLTPPGYMCLLFSWSTVDTHRGPETGTLPVHIFVIAGPLSFAVTRIDLSVIQSAKLVFVFRPNFAVLLQHQRS